MRATLVLLFFVSFLLLVSSSKPIQKGDWVLVEEVADEEILTVSVGLTIRNAEWLNNFFAQVSNPKHPNWRKFLTKSQLRAKIAPFDDQVSYVVNFLESKGGRNFVKYPTGDFLTVDFMAKDLESLLNIQMHTFRHVEKGIIIHRSLYDYRLPLELRGKVDVFGMVSEFPAGHLSSRTSQKKINHSVYQQRNSDPAPITCIGKPNFGYPASSDTDLYSQVQIVCCNGQYTKNLTSPCWDVDNVYVSGFNLTVWNNKTGEDVYQDRVYYEDVKQSCFLDGVSITCQVPFTNNTQLQPYELYNMKISLGYNGPVSNYTVFPTALVTSAFVTPQLFNRYYEIPLNYQGKTPNNNQSVVEFGGQYYSPSDLKNFFGNMSLPNSPVILVGPNNPLNPGDEATLDIEWIMAIGNRIPTVFWSVAAGYLLEWTQQLLSRGDTPLVNSVSYAGNEMDSPQSYRSRVDQEFQKLGTLGISIVVASGDAGATDVGHGFDACSPFQPQYPSSSPYVTTVSATFFTPYAQPICDMKFYGKENHCSSLNMGEVAVSAGNGMDWTTGGGFSNFVPRPYWQNDVVNQYLSNYSDLLPPSNMFNSSNRAYPDVSTIGHNLLLILNDQMDIGDGTSASTPIFTAILAMLNDWLLDNGKAPIGFANPLLYQIFASNPQAFYDVTRGSNRCGDVLHPPYIACCPYGYESTLGWDPVTGLGTPRFAQLLESLKQLVS